MAVGQGLAGTGSTAGSTGQLCGRDGRERRDRRRGRDGYGCGTSVERLRRAGTAGSIGTAGSTGTAGTTGVAGSTGTAGTTDGGTTGGSRRLRPAGAGSTRTGTDLRARGMSAGCNKSRRPVR